MRKGRMERSRRRLRAAQGLAGEAPAVKISL
jgi:hypothetical protein